VGLHSHWGGRKVLAAKPGVGSSIKRIVERCPVILRASPFVRKQRWEKAPRVFDVSNVGLNRTLNQAFLEDRWERQPSVTPANKRYRADFSRERVHVEVELANSGRWYADAMKFMISHTAGLIDLGILIVPMYNLARRINYDIVRFERVSEEMSYIATAFKVPIYVLGVDDDVAVCSTRRAEAEGLASPREARQGLLAETCEGLGEGREARGWESHAKPLVPDHRGTVLRDHVLLRYAHQGRQSPGTQAGRR